MGLVEERDDLVAFLETGDAGAGGDDGSSAVGEGDYGQVGREGVLAFGDDQVAVIERGAGDWLVLVRKRTRDLGEVLLTRTSCSPIDGTAAEELSVSDSLGPPLALVTDHAFCVEGAIVRCAFMIWVRLRARLCIETKNGS